MESRSTRTTPQRITVAGLSLSVSHKDAGYSPFLDFQSELLATTPKAKPRGDSIYRLRRSRHD